MGQKSRDTGLRWRRPASMAALGGIVLVGVVALVANLTAIAEHDWRWFVLAGVAFLVFLGLIAYGLAANKARERAELRRAARTEASTGEPASRRDVRDNDWKDG